ncbi:hypothetical protein NA56DRAFT_422904 [Hyaloscypha hepaticicola]|uniref:C2H2-type domain-containing protein n=1 Tax=Hyaloscypha hepaticicola TaxID=2082293 RepID=A0A2J6PHE6_9HELO|nr:hypothetical protein NA56DRAFT_422904 [Hyaloscypha hepaticicola]
MLQRWRDSPPDVEPAKISAIRNASVSWAVCSFPKLDTAPTLDYEQSFQVSHFDEEYYGSSTSDLSLPTENFLLGWRSAASSNCSAASSAARSHTSSISFARRKYKNRYRRSDSCDQSRSDHLLNLMKAIKVQEGESTLGSNLLIHSPPTPLSPLQPDPEDFQGQPGGNGLVLGDMELCEKPEDFSAVSNEDANIQLTLNHNQGTKFRLSQITTKRSHSCQRYRCESCTHRFNTEEEWRTHETLVHRPREEWVCSLVPFMNDTLEDWKCAFCQSLFTSWEPFILHRCRPCGSALTSPVSKPVFNTRAGLADHVKHHHEGAILTPFMVEKWSRPPTWKEGIWSCGTCVSCEKWTRLQV